MKKIKELIQVLQENYQVRVVKEGVRKEKLSLQFPLWGFIGSAVVFFFLLLIFFFLFVKHSPVREYLNTEGSSAVRSQLVDATRRVDSLAKVNQEQTLYLENLRKVLTGSIGETLEEAEQREAKSSLSAPKLPKEAHTKLEREDQIALQNLLELSVPLVQDSTLPTVKESGSMKGLVFYAPVKGVVTGTFNKEKRHFATDIATKDGEPILAVLDGEVVFASFTPDTGYVIIMQHSQNLLSIYKHCSALLKKEGVSVRAGEVLALVGSTGRMSSGPHLHFELWSEGSPVNAEQYIRF